MAGITANSSTKTMVSGDTAADQALAGWLRAEKITLATSPTGTSYAWQLTNPAGSSMGKAYISDAEAAAPTFIPDIGGTYVVTVTVDGTTSYTLRLGVLDTAASEPVEAVRFTPRTDAQFAAPALGKVLGYSSDESDLVTKDSSGVVRRVLQGAAAGAEYGSLYWSTPAATTLSLDTWAKAAGTTTLGPSNEFTMPANNRLLHDDTDTEVYHIAWSGSLTSSGNNQILWLGLSKNGATPAEGSWRQRKVSTGSDVGAASTDWLFSLASTDYVELWVKNETSTATITIQNGALIAVKLV